MPKEILLEITARGLYWPLAVVIITYFFNWIVFFKLGFQIAGARVGIGRLLPGALVCSLFSLGAKQFFSELVFGLLLVILFTLLLKTSGRLLFFKAFWASFFVYSLSALGVIIIVQPLMVFTKTSLFLLNTPIGVAVGTLIELVFPAIAFFLLSTFNLSILPPHKHRATKLDILGISLFGILFLSIYNLTVMFLLSYKNALGYLLIKIIILELIVMLGGVLLFFVIRTLTQKQWEHEKLRFEQEKLSLQLKTSNRLLETLASEQREFRNRLQVMNMLASLGKNGELTNYIINIASRMSATKEVEIENPILVSALLSQRILGKERGIETVIHSNTSLNDFTIDLIKLGEILNIVLELIIENEILSKSITKAVFLEIKEESETYCFEFNNSEEAALNFRSGKNRNYKMAYTLKYHEEGLEKFKVAEDLIKELGGESSYIIKGGHVVQLGLKIKKKKPGYQSDN